LGYVKALEEQKKNLTVEGKLDEALAVKKDIEKIQQRYNVASAGAESQYAMVLRALVGKWKTSFTPSGTQGFYVFTEDGMANEYDAHGKPAWNTGRWTIENNEVVIRSKAHPNAWVKIYLPIRPAISSGYQDAGETFRMIKIQ